MEKLDRLRLHSAGEQHGHVLANCALDQKVRECPGCLATVADNDTRRVQVIVKRLALAQKFRREDDAVKARLFAHPADEPDRNGGFYDNRRFRRDLAHLSDHRLHAGGIESVGFGIVVCRCRDHHEICVSVGASRVGGCGQLQRLFGQPFADLFVLDWRHTVIDHIRPGRIEVNGSHLVLLGQQNCIRQSNITKTRNGNFHKQPSRSSNRRPVTADPRKYSIPRY